MNTSEAPNEQAACDESYLVFFERRKEWTLNRTQQIKEEMIYGGWSDSGTTEAEALYQAIKESGSQMSDKAIWDAAWLAALVHNAELSRDVVVGSNVGLCNEGGE